MFKKWKLTAAAVAMTASILLPSTLAYAVEVSEETIEVTGEKEMHTVIAFGKSIAIVYSDGKTAIIANNLSGRIDVMIDGKVTKGIGIVVIPAQSGTNLVMEEDSFIVNGISDSQVEALKKMVMENLSAERLITSAAMIENGGGMQGVKAFSIDAKGTLHDSNGDKAPVGVLQGMQVKTPEVAYQSFVEEMQESIRIEQEESAQKAEEEQAVSSDNGVTSWCIHEWEPYDLDILHFTDRSKCATGPFYKCTKCRMLTWWNENTHIHGEDYCEYCGYNMYGNTSSSECTGGGIHEYEDYNAPSSGKGPIMAGDHKRCWTGLIHECTKCGLLNVTDATENEHGEDYCSFCGYNQNGEKRTN